MILKTNKPIYGFSANCCLSLRLSLVDEKCKNKILLVIIIQYSKLLYLKSSNFFHPLGLKSRNPTNNMAGLLVTNNVT